MAEQVSRAKVAHGVEVYTVSFYFASKGAVTMKRISVADVQNNRFYQLPKWLIHDDRFKNISNDARVAYSLLKDRHELSMANDWVDEQGNVYLYYSRENLSEILNCGLKKTIKVMKELKDYSLIEEDRQGQGKTNMIYLMAITVENTLTCQKDKSGPVKKTP